MPPVFEQKDGTNCKDAQKLEPKDELGLLWLAKKVNLFARNCYLATSRLVSNRITHMTIELLCTPLTFMNTPHAEKHHRIPSSFIFYFFFT